MPALRLNYKQTSSIRRRTIDLAHLHLPSRMTSHHPPVPPSEYSVVVIDTASTLANPTAPVLHSLFSALDLHYTARGLPPRQTITLDNDHPPHRNILLVNRAGLNVHVVPYINAPPGGYNRKQGDTWGSGVPPAIVAVDEVLRGLVADPHVHEVVVISGTPFSAGSLPAVLSKPHCRVLLVGADRGHPEVARYSSFAPDNVVDLPRFFASIQGHVSGGKSLTELLAAPRAAAPVRSETGGGMNAAPRNDKVVTWLDS